jgi:tetratricopeptide (TPR) repeat protein
MTPPDAMALHIAAILYLSQDRKSESDDAFARSLALNPDPTLYLDRALNRPRDDVAGRRSDIDAALRLAPEHKRALFMQAEWLADHGDAAEAIRSYTRSIAAKSDDLDDMAALLRRGILHVRSGMPALADADFAAAHARITAPDMLAESCETKARAEIALDTALGECQQAVKLSPDNISYREMLGFVLLRLGRLDDAVREYDRALVRRPTMAYALYGRALALARKGDAARAARDHAAALAADPEIAKSFARYGLTG